MAAEWLLPQMDEAQEWEEGSTTKSFIDPYHAAAQHHELGKLSFGSYRIGVWVKILFKEVGLAGPFLCAFVFSAASVLATSLVEVGEGKPVDGRRSKFKLNFFLAAAMALAALYLAVFAVISKGQALPTRTVEIVAAACLFNACCIF